MKQLSNKIINEQAIFDDIDVEKIYDNIYKISVFAFLNGSSEPLDISKDLIEFRIIEDYNDNNKFYIEMASMVSPTLLSTIQNNYRDIIYSISVELTKVNFEGVEIDNKFIFKDRLFESIEPELSILPVDESLDPEDEAYQEDETFSVVLGLFEVNTIKINNKLNNYTFENVTLEEVLYFLVSHNLPGSTKVSIEKLSNFTRYKNIIIPPLNLFDCITYLDKVYGLYEQELNIYMNIDTLFIQSTSRSSDPINLIVYRMNSNSVYRNMHYTEDNKNILTTSTFPRLEINDTSSHHINGEQKILLSVDAQSNVTIVEQDLTAGLVSKEHKRKSTYTYVSFDNKYVSSKVSSKLSSEVERLTINLENMDISYLKPKLTFDLKFFGAYSEYKGLYKLDYCICKFNRLSEGNFFSVVEAVMSRK